MKAPTWNALNGKHVGLLFEKPSLRTRVTFTIGVRELGGDIVEIPADVMHADREPINDVARNLERWVDAVVIRTFAQERLHQIAEITPKLHVINALSNEEHPCQALADMQTLIERWGSLAGRAHRVRRRRQQRLHVARARGDDARHRRATSRRRKDSSCPTKWSIRPPRCRRKARD